MAQEIRFYTDENVSGAMIEALRRRGLDVLTTPEADMLGATDEEHLALATREGRVVITHDQDFLRLASRSIAHAGVAFATNETPLSRIVIRLVQLHNTRNASDAFGRVIYL